MQAAAVGAIIKAVNSAKVTKMIKVPSFTHPNKEYMVRQFDDGTFACNCPHFLSRGKRLKSCKHILVAKKEL